MSTCIKILLGNIFLRLKSHPYFQKNSVVVKSTPSSNWIQHEKPFVALEYDYEQEVSVQTHFTPVCRFCAQLSDPKRASRVA